MKAVIKSSKKTLYLGIFATCLAGCGGDTDQNNQRSAEATTNTVQGDTSLFKSLFGFVSTRDYPEPQKDTFPENTAGFYDENAEDATRSIRNDLAGNFTAMIQFSQNHTVDPTGNAAKQMPRLTSEKDTLLLVTPTTDMGDLIALNAEIYSNSRLIRRIALQEPSRIPASDQTNSDSRLKVQYSKQAWTAHLNWDEVKPGLNIRIIEPTSRKNGRLAATDIDFAAPGELVVQSIRLGLLSDPPTANFLFLNSPEVAGADYLQTIPAAKITVTKYDDMILRKVMVGSGKIYDTISDTHGDVYSGDMRENTAKSTFSTGINLANWGITSAGMVSQQQPQLTQSVVIHHARGSYQNGYATHGLSGGNGILTLIDSVGNEFSHEIGHHFGLGHYPGQSGENYFWASHHHDSGWSYMSYRKRMRGNIIWDATNLSNRLNGTPLYKNQYIFAPDSMAGGSFSSSLSRYTHYTGYSTYHKIQPAFAKPVWDENSPTGYKLWNAATRQMEVYQPKVPSSNEVWYNRADGNYLKPNKFGVPVFTIVGGYDPVTNVGLLYPAARGNWGNVFNLPQADTSLNSSSCWASVTFLNKPAENIALAPIRMGSNANKFHINLAQSDSPKHVDLYCKKSGEEAVKLSSIDIPNYTTPLPAAVILGQKYGFSVLRQIEQPLLEQALIANQGKLISSLSTSNKILYDSYREYKNDFSATARTELDRYEQQEGLLYRLNRWVNVYRQDLFSSPAANNALRSFISELGLPTTNPMQGATMLVMPNMNSACLKAEKTLGASSPSLFMSGRNGCDGQAETLWIYDAVGKIHSARYPEYCIAGAGLALCNNSMNNQIWSATISGNTQLFNQGNICLDLTGGHVPAVNGRGSLTTYSCTSGNNQKWSAVQQSQNFVLAASSSQNLPILINALSSQ